MDQLKSHGFFSPDHAVLSVGSDKLFPTLFERPVCRLQRRASGFPHLIAADTLGILAVTKPEPE